MKNKDEPNNVCMKIELEYNDCECSYENCSIEREFVSCDGLYPDQLMVFVHFLKSQNLDNDGIKELFSDYIDGYI